MSYDGGYPHIKCVTPNGVTMEMLVEALYEQNGMCVDCGAAFDNEDYCVWDTVHRVQHIDCKWPSEPSEELLRGAEKLIRDCGVNLAKG